MTKSDIIKQLTRKCGLTTSAAAAAVECTLNAIAESLTEGNNVYLRGFATFKVRTLAAKVGRNVKAGTPIAIPAHRTARLVLSKDLKAKLNKE
jgi:DNA-binding protein HU-beta